MTSHSDPETPKTFYLELTQVTHEFAEFTSSMHIASVVLPVEEWQRIGRPSYLSFVPTPEAMK